MKVLITPIALMNGQVKLIDSCTKFSFGLSYLCTKELCNGEIRLSRIQRKVCGVYRF